MEQIPELLGGHLFHPPAPLGEPFRGPQARGRQGVGVLGEQFFLIHRAEKIDVVDLAVLVVVFQDRQVLQELGVRVGDQVRHEQEARRRRGDQSCGGPQGGPQTPPRPLDLGLRDILGSGHGDHLQGRAREVFAGGRCVELVEHVPGAVEFFQHAAGVRLDLHALLDPPALLGIELAVEIGHQLLAELVLIIGRIVGHRFHHSSPPATRPSLVTALSESWLFSWGRVPSSKYGSSICRRFSRARDSSDLTACGDNSMALATLV